MLTVIERAHKKGDKQTYWLCQCECGNKTVVSAAHLKNGHTKSCGCLHAKVMKEMLVTHGLSGTKLFRVWRGIIDRTQYKSHKSYKYYGGRGIKICSEWANNFESFYKWAMGSGYKDGLQIDRVDVNGDYRPENCKWATPKQQQNNRRNNRYITYNGETHTMKEWSEITGIKYTTLSMRLNKYHWDVRRALNAI